MIAMSFVVSSKNRPRIVTSIGRLRLIYGILAMGFGLLLVFSPTAYLDFMGESLSDYSSMEEVAFYAGFIGIFVATQGVVGVVIALATLYGKKWAWTGNVIFSSILILLAVSDVALGYTTSIIGIFFNGFILVYMFARPVKAYFGRMGPAPNPIAASTAAA